MYSCSKPDLIRGVESMAVDGFEPVGRQTDHYETRVGGDYTAQRATLLDAQ